MYILFHFLNYCSIAVVSIFPQLLSPHCTPTPTVIPHPVVHAHGSLTRPFPFLPPLFPFPYPYGYCQFVLYCQISGSILLMCLFGWLGPTLGEIIWYLSFASWLISLSIMLSSSIHVAMKSRSSFFLLHSTSLCKCTTVFWSTHVHLGCFQQLGLWDQICKVTKKYEFETEWCTKMRGEQIVCLEEVS